jgi:hypothetical protein
MRAKISDHRSTRFAFIVLITDVLMQFIIYEYYMLIVG